MLPQWGDGKSDPALTDDELVIDAEKFDPSVREGLVEFFRKALHRDPEQRFDNADEMRWAWQQVFKEAETAEDQDRRRRGGRSRRLAGAGRPQDARLPPWASPPVPATPWSGPTSSPSATCWSSPSATST